MKTLVLLLTSLFLITISETRVSALDHQHALQQFGSMMEGSWTPLEQEDARGPIRHVYSWVLNGKFMRTNGTQDPERSWDGFVGIEPKSGKMAWWGFFASGSVGPVYLTEASDTEWTFSGDKVGDDGNLTRSVTILKTGDARIRAIVKDTLDGETITSLDAQWVRSGAGKSIATVEKPHPWEFLTGDWEFTSSKGIQADVTFKTIAGGMASVAHWMTDEGKPAVELVGWNADKQCLVVDGYGVSGNYWHVEYTTVGAKKCSGPSTVVYPDGSSVKGIMTIEKVDANTVKLHADGVDENGKPIEVNSQWKRRTD